MKRELKYIFRYVKFSKSIVKFSESTVLKIDFHKVTDKPEAND